MVPASKISSFVFSRIDGGGGGSRTRVRKSSTKGIYMLSFIWSALAGGLRWSRRRIQPAPLISSPLRGRSEETSRLLGVLGACHRQGRPQDVTAY